jgi:hypothetical protein
MNYRICSLKISWHLALVFDGAQEGDGLKDGYTLHVALQMSN